MRQRTRMMLAVGLLGCSAAVCFGQAPSDSSEALRVLRAENKLLRLQVQALRERFKALTDENDTLKVELKKKGRTAVVPARSPATRPAKPKTTTKPVVQPVTRPTKPLALPVTRGPVRVSAISATIRHVLVWNKYTEKNTGSKDKLLGIVVGLQNLSESREVRYRTWGADARKIFGSSASLTDNLGNKYKPIHFGRMDVIVGRTDNESIAPGKAITDMLVFEVPIAKAKTLILSLPLKNVGGGGTVELRIPVKRIRRD